MKTSNKITKAIDKKLRAANEKKKASWKSSGKLSAGKLGWPLQWQCLSHLKVDPPPVDDYTLRKFLRGNQIEDWLVTMIPDLQEKQKFVEYRNTVGYIDAVVGGIPHEIKSVTNAKYKWITKKKAADDAHLLQAAFYATALGTDTFAINYVASDDLRVTTYVCETDDYKDRIDSIIDTYDKQIAQKEVPVFKPMYPWQGDMKYSTYPEWMELNEQEIKDKMERLDISF